jgi:hypothetical protein
MSNTTETTLCANCGKGEDDGINLKSCTACKLVKYCSRDCQIAHRPRHKKACKKRAKELHDEKLFKQPPAEDCPICMIRLPMITGWTYMPCCGKVICSGCIHAVQSRATKQEHDICPFCRTPPLSSREENKMIKRYEKRMELNDPIAIYDMGCMYKDGECGCPQNDAKALELWHRAAELGDATAYYSIGVAYDIGNGVERDEKKANHYWELAAMGGNVTARHNLGVREGLAFKMDRALRHWMIAVDNGYAQSLENIEHFYKNGYATKDDYAKALRSYQAYLNEIKSAQRDEAASTNTDQSPF